MAISDFDNPALNPEQFLQLPWLIDPGASWLDWQCWIEVDLDAGMALHKILPQQAFGIDSLASIDCQSGTLDQFTSQTGGVNYASDSTAQDFIQRMGTSTYRFFMKGFGLRVGYQIPIPALLSVGGVNAVPEAKQNAYNQVVGNYSGIPLWYAQWELRYIITGPNLSPGTRGVPQTVPIPYNPAVQIRPDAQLPDSVVLPWTQADTNFVRGT